VSGKKLIARYYQQLAKLVKCHPQSLINAFVLTNSGFLPNQHFFWFYSWPTMEATTNFLLQTITGSQSNTLLQSIDLVTVWLGQLDGAWLAAFLKSTVFKNDDKEILQNVDKEFRLKHREVVEKAVQCTYNLW
jgi:hypothetical protein